MTTNNPYAQYRNVKINTSDRGALILLLFDGAIRFCQGAKDCINERDQATEKGRLVLKAYDIVAELRKSLRPVQGSELTDELDKTYAFITRQLTLANVLNKEEHLDNALLMLTDLRDAWRQVVRQERETVSI